MDCFKYDSKRVDLMAASECNLFLAMGAVSCKQERHSSGYFPLAVFPSNLWGLNPRRQLALCRKIGSSCRCARACSGLWRSRGCTPGILRTCSSFPFKSFQNARPSWQASEHSGVAAVATSQPKCRPNHLVLLGGTVPTCIAPAGCGGAWPIAAA